jgi:hypothetical protein
MLRVRRLVEGREDAGGECRRAAAVDQVEHGVQVDVAAACEVGGEIVGEPGCGETILSPLHYFRWSRGLI